MKIRVRKSGSDEVMESTVETIIAHEEGNIVKRKSYLRIVAKDFEVVVDGDYDGKGFFEHIGVDFIKARTPSS